MEDGRISSAGRDGGLSRPSIVYNDLVSPHVFEAANTCIFVGPVRNGGEAIFAGLPKALWGPGLRSMVRWNAPHARDNLLRDTLPPGFKFPEVKDQGCRNRPTGTSPSPVSARQERRAPMPRRWRSPSCVLGRHRRPRLRKYWNHICAPYWKRQPLRQLTPQATSIGPYGQNPMISKTQGHGNLVLPRSFRLSQVGGLKRGSTHDFGTCFPLRFFRISGA